MLQILEVKLHWLSYQQVLYMKLLGVQMTLAMVEVLR